MGWNPSGVFDHPCQVQQIPCHEGLGNVMIHRTHHLYGYAVFSRIALEISIRPCVCESSGERFNVQLINIAFRSEKSHLLVEHISSCLSLNVAISLLSLKTAA